MNARIGYLNAAAAPLTVPPQQQATSCTHSHPQVKHLPLSLASPGEARAFVEQAICPAHGGDALVAAQLVASELVTHAVLHGEPPVTLTVSCNVTEIVVVVHDGNRGDRGVVEPQDTLRMALVEKVSRSMGVDMTDEGKQRWCTVPTGTVPETGRGFGGWDRVRGGR